jgi:hypothetical protein
MKFVLLKLIFISSIVFPCRGEEIISRPSPEFIKSGGKWTIGQPSMIDIDKVRQECVVWLNKNKPKKWKHHRMSLDKWIEEGEEGNFWVINLTFKTDDGDLVVMICNFKGEIWPLGKKFDDFKGERVPKAGP